MNINYSIIIPHKNIPELLQRCLDSIPKRDDVQVIVVDDNSDEGVVDFNNFPGKTCINTFVFFDKSNKGAGRARNIGLDHAKGEWVIFADADDQFEKGFCEILDCLGNDNTSDVVNFDLISKDLETGEINDEIDKIHYHCTDNKYINDPMLFKYITLVPWGKVIRRSFIQSHNLRFEEVKYGNDLYFASLCDFYCKHRRIIPIVGYCWMRRTNSLWRQENLEWAEVRFYVLLKNGKRMCKLNEYKYGHRLIRNSRRFSFLIRKYSYYRHIKAEIAYGLATNDYYYVFVSIPRIVLGHIKEKFFVFFIINT